MSWKRFSRRDCPICSGTRKDCRQNITTGLIHCRELDAAPSGYIFRGYDSLGFGMWTDQVEAEAWTEEKRREWQEMRRQERERKQARRARLLAYSERDAAIRQILNQLELSQENQAQLRQRGMSDEQIELGMYRSVKPWQRLQFPVTAGLAGVQRSGKQLYVPASGILCPIPNHRGEFVGWQIRLDNSGELPKYLWASSEKKHRQDGPSAHLKNGELPLAFFAPSSQRHKVVSQWFKNSDTTLKEAGGRRQRAEGEKLEEDSDLSQFQVAFKGKACTRLGGREKISSLLPPVLCPLPSEAEASVIPVALTEGVAFKPAIATHRLGIYSIGASGGHFASSPQTLKTYLEHIEAVCKAKSQQASAIQPLLFADAGCLTNENVLKVYDNTVRKIKELGFELKIAWWGQAEKNAADIDEIAETTLNSIRLLSYQEFLSLVKKTQRDLHVEAVQRGLQSLSYEPNVRLQDRYLRDLAQRIPVQGIVALKSPKGSGKSVQIKKISASARSRGMKVISLTPRRALGREQSLKWDIEWGGDAEVTGIHRLTLLENLETVGICWDSLWKLMERDWSHTLVIIDESELALVHLLLSSTCKEKRPLILRVLETKLQECLANGGTLLIADADLTDLSIDYFQSLVPDAPFFVVANEYGGRETRWQIDFHTGKKDTTISNLIADVATPVIEEKGERQRRIVIPTDSQDQAEALERFIRERFPHLLTIRIDSTTTETDEGRAFVERPNEKILELQPDVLIYTPSMGAGVSIDVPWFDRMYAFFNGVIEPSQCRQMLGRIRATIPRTIWCRSRGQVEGSTSFLPEEIKSHLFTFHRETSILIDVAKAIAPDDPTDWQIRQAYDAIWNREKQAWDNPHVDLYCSLMARKNYGLSHLASELRRQLIAEGHLLIDSDGGGSTDEGLRVAQLKKQLPVEEAQAIALAEDIPLDLALLLKQKPNLTQQQRHQITKALLSAELLGVTLDPAFIYKAVTKDHRKWLNAQKLFWYCQHPEQVKVMDRREWLDHLRQFSNGAVYLPDIRTYSLQVKVLHDIGLFRVIDLNCPDQEYSGDAEAIGRLLQKARKFSRNIHTAFNLKVTKQSKPIQLINHLLKRVGLHLKFQRQVAKGQRFYRIDLNKLNDPDRITVLNSLSQKWAQLSSESQFWASQRKSIESNNTDLCCESEPFSLTDKSHQKVEVVGEIAREKTVSQKSAQLVSESDSWASQRTSVDINNTGICCQPKRASNLPDGFIPEEYQEGVLDVSAWLSEAVLEAPETFQAILDVAMEYLRLFPQAKTSLWKVMIAHFWQPEVESEF